MTQKKELHPRVIVATEPVHPQWLEAYLLANDNFALIPPAIDVIVGIPIIHDVFGGLARWQDLAHMGFDDKQFSVVGAAMNRHHRSRKIQVFDETYHVPDHKKEKARGELEHYKTYHNRPAQTNAYDEHADGTHMVVKSKVLKGTWPGIAGENARAAVRFAHALGFRSPKLEDVYTRRIDRSNYLHEPVLEALDDFFVKPKWNPFVGTLLDLYHTAAAYAYSDEGIALARKHQKIFDLHHEHGVTPFRVTDELETFIAGMEGSLKANIEKYKQHGALPKQAHFQPFVRELIKHDKLT